MHLILGCDHGSPCQLAAFDQFSPTTEATVVINIVVISELLAACRIWLRLSPALGRAGRELCAKRFAAATMVEQLEAIYEAQLERR